MVSVSTPVSRRRKILYTCLVCAAGASAIFALGEFYIRRFSPLDDAGWYDEAGDPVLFYRLRANVAGDDHGRRRTQTAQRLRGPGPAYEQDAAEGVWRVLWIGDSACFGSGCDDDQTAPKVFDELATRRGVAVESINLAVVGYNVRQVREVLAQRAQEFRGARTVVYYHHENDVVNAPWAQLAPRLPADLYWDYEPPQPFVKKLIKRSAVVRRLWNTDLAVRLRGGGEYGIDAATVRAALPDRSVTLPIHGFTRKCVELYDDGNEYGRRFREELRRMAELSSARGAGLVFVYWPSRTLLHHVELDTLRRTLRQWCLAEGVVFIDVTEAFLADSSADLYVDSIHPGPAGQRLIARAVLDAIQGPLD